MPKKWLQWLHNPQMPDNQGFRRNQWSGYRVVTVVTVVTE